jgi:hypothetical protein
MKEIHSNCKVEKLLTEEEILFDENIIYPKWMKEI